MKRYVIILFVIATIVACNGKKELQNSENNTTTVVISEKDFNFGTIHQSDSIVHAFKVKNTGSIPLILKSAKASCGCTIAEWSKSPILPNKEGFVKVKFKPNNSMSGIINKSIVIQANTDSVFHVVYIKGTVEKI